jgi:hypothetical protein
MRRRRGGGMRRRWRLGSDRGRDLIIMNMGTSGRSSTSFGGN